MTLTEAAEVVASCLPVILLALSAAAFHRLRARATAPAQAPRRREVTAPPEWDGPVGPDDNLEDAECPHCFADAFRAKGTDGDFQCAGCHHRFPYDERSTRRPYVPLYGTLSDESPEMEPR